MAPLTCPWKAVSRNPAEPTRARTGRGCSLLDHHHGGVADPRPAQLARCGAHLLLGDAAGGAGRCVVADPRLARRAARRELREWGAANGGRRRSDGTGCRRRAARSPGAGSTPRPRAASSTRSRAASRRLGMERRVVASGRAGQGREQCDLAERELVRRLAEVEPGGRPHPLDVAAVGSQVQVDLEQLLLGVAAARAGARGSSRGAWTPASAARAPPCGRSAWGWSRRRRPPRRARRFDHAARATASGSTPGAARTAGPRRPPAPAAAREAAPRAAPGTATARPPAGRSAAARPSGPSPRPPAGRSQALPGEREEQVEQQEKEEGAREHQGRERALLRRRRPTVTS